MNQCPECNKGLPPNAVRCRCGWVASTGRPDYIPCAFAGCGYSAKIKRLTKTGWANICLDHDLKMTQQSAEAYCKSLGLTTTAEKRAWCKANARGMVKRFVEAQPEPEAEEIPF